MKKQNYTNSSGLNSERSFQKSPRTKKDFNHIENNNNKFIYNSNEKSKNMKKNYSYKINNNSKRGKLGKLEYEIEPRDILLIPDNFNVKNNNIKISEKDLETKEKTYFISESNFQLIKDALNEKENSINDLKLMNEKYIKQISLLEEENSKLEKINNELILQIEKNDIYFNKMYELLKYVFNYYNSFNDESIKKFIKEQNLEYLFNKKKVYPTNENEKNNNNSDNNQKNSIESLFKINQDEIIEELEKTKKMYNDIRKQLNYITNIKSKDKENLNNNNIEILNNQKKLNDLNLENQNNKKEIAYLKLLCKNTLLDKKISDIDDNSEIIKELEKNLVEEKNKNNNLIKENEILKNKYESLLNEMNILKLNLNKSKQENQIKNQEIEKNKYEIEKLEKIINEKNLKPNDELNNKNNIYSKKMTPFIKKQTEFSLKTLKISNAVRLKYPSSKQCKKVYSKIIASIPKKQTQFNFKKLKISNEDKLFIPSNKQDEFTYFSENMSSLIKKQTELNSKELKISNTDKIFYPSDEQDEIYNNNKLNYGFGNDYDGNIENIDLLMLLYNKSKQNETYIKNK